MPLSAVFYLPERRELFMDRKKRLYTSRQSNNNKEIHEVKRRRKNIYLEGCLLANKSRILEKAGASYIYIANCKNVVDCFHTSKINKGSEELGY
ncbi:hypothetical protein CDAR_18931 [Caerostris darwini]|uniref:Uncharacterized protein n=1 Tax=Caerostris darwini TaxID=1538125 RepID=A0AAV4WFU9_9ARAC|nr:hypothetical protein CDAR_18931 [Caerostris darwini]